ncbi:hypothetical protein BBJ28_00018993, partial [Nothophytophthora sp. Chile5]
SLQSPPGNNYEKRTDAGKTVSEFNAHLKKEVQAMDLDASDTERLVEITAPFPSRNLAPNSSYMYTPLFQRAIALDEQLVEYEELVKETFKLEELKPVGDPSPAQVTVVGRIVCEAAEGKLNPSVAQIEGSRKTCGGQRVLLDLSGVPNFQIFPGKIVALEGVYPDTRSPMVVKRFLEVLVHFVLPSIERLHRVVTMDVAYCLVCTCQPIPAPIATSSPTRIKEIQAKSGKPVRVLTACGPFTTTNNVDYLPLNDLLHIVVDQKPDVLILVRGIESIAGLGSMLFSIQVGGGLSRCDVLCVLQIVVVPSLRDAHHEYVYPQPPFNKKKVCEVFESPEYAKRVKDSICVNPGQLCKGESGGTFAAICILPLANDKIESASDDKCAHFVPDRTIIEIKRI